MLFRSAKGKAKQAALAELTGAETRVLNMILDPYSRYGICGLSPDHFKTSGDGVAEEVIESFLLSLVNRSLTGGAANVRLHEICMDATPEQQEVIHRILLKDPKAGVGASTVNKVFKKLIPEFKVALAAKYDPDMFKGERIVSPKLDGIRMIARVDAENSSVQWMTREGNPITSMEHLSSPVLAFGKTLIKEAVGLNGCGEGYGGLSVIYLDGEAVSGNFNATVSALRKKGKAAEDAEYAIFDFFTENSLNGKQQLESWTQYERQGFLELVRSLWNNADAPLTAKIRVLKCLLVSDDARVQAIYKALRAKGYEGVIVKDMNAKYSFKRNRCWSKIKDQIDADGEIIGFEQGDANKEYADTLGAIVVKLESGIVVKVASGLTKLNREEIWNNQDKYIGRVIELLGHEYTPDGSIRHPRLSNFPRCLRDSEAFTGSKI